MGEKLEELRAWVTAYPTSTVPMLHGAVAEHDAELAALVERAERAEDHLGDVREESVYLAADMCQFRADRDEARAALVEASNALHSVRVALEVVRAERDEAIAHAERAEEGLSFEKQVAHGLSLSLDNMRADRDRLRKLFDDAGQGEHNVLALVDHYQEQALDRDRLAAELAAVRGSGGVLTREECAALLSPLYGARGLTSNDVEARNGEACARAQHARNVARVLEAMVGLEEAANIDATTASAIRGHVLAALTGDAAPAPAQPSFTLDAAMAELGPILGAPPGESWDALLERVRGMVSERDEAQRDLREVCSLVNMLHQHSTWTHAHGPTQDLQITRDRLDCMRQRFDDLKAGEMPAQPPTLHLTAEDREQLWKLAVEEVHARGVGGGSHVTWAEVGVEVGYTIGVEAALAAVQSKAVGHVVFDRPGGPWNMSVSDVLREGVTAARRVVKVPAKEEPGDDWKTRAEKAEADLAAMRELDGVRASEAEMDLMNEVSRLKEELAGAHRPTPPADLDGYVRAYDVAVSDAPLNPACQRAGIAAVLAARDAWWRERLTRRDALDAFDYAVERRRRGGLDQTSGDLTNGMRAAIAHVLGSDGEAPKPEPAAPALPTLCPVSGETLAEWRSGECGVRYATMAWLVDAELRRGAK